jgi:hypothetical protein
MAAMADAKRQASSLMLSVVLFVVSGFLEAKHLWGDSQKHWQNLGFERIALDYFLLPMIIIPSCVDLLLRFKSGHKPLRD